MAGRHARLGLPAVLLAAMSLACAGSDDGPAPAGGWLGTITTEGNVTTVLNEAGSVWGSPATLREEASIGVDKGAEEYVLGMIMAIAVTDTRIYVADVQVPAVRAYDHAGGFVGTVGRSGQGPGEYQLPVPITTHDDVLLVYDDPAQRLTSFDASGAALATWSFPSARCCMWPIYALDRESIWAPVQEWLEDAEEERRYGVQAVGPAGPGGAVMWVPDIEHQQAKYRVRGSDRVAPFSSWLQWNPTPAGGIVAGASDRYRFEVHGADGTVLIVEHVSTPIPVPPEQREWERRRTIAAERHFNDPGWTWDGAEIPEYKPAYAGLIPALSGETWVVRRGPSRRLEDCAEDPVAAGHLEASARPCWTASLSADVFGADGRYLGSVELPESAGTSATTFVVDGDRIVTTVQDELGTVRVKRYRLVLEDGSVAFR